MASRIGAYVRKVDKIIIAQDSLRHFLNDISPGAYMSLTKVDFKALDKFQIKPTGIYGSKDEIVRLLRCVAVIDDAMYMSPFFLQFIVLTDNSTGRPS